MPPERRPKGEKIMYIKLDREYEVKCNLGTIREIERSLGKGFYEIMQNISALTTDNQLKMLFSGVKRANPAMTFEEFYALCEDNLGMGDLMEYLEKYLYALQYPGLTQAEVQQKIEKKLQRGREMQSNV